MKAFGDRNSIVQVARA